MCRGCFTCICTVFGFVTSFSVAAALGASPEPPWPTKAWPEATPRSQGIDSGRLGELVDLIRANKKFPDLHGLLVVRRGYLILEEYFAGFDADRLHTLQSVSKSFTSAVVGIALAQKKFHGLDERVLDFFPDLEGIQNVDDRKRAITIHDLLTMQSGTDYHERGSESPHFQLNAKKGGWTEFILSRPMISQPGTRFQYDSGAVILTSSLIEVRTGQHADVLMSKELFKPLGITQYEWYKNKEGHPHTGGGLHLRPRDMAKLGLLYLRKGKWEHRQVLPAEWVEASTRLQVTFSPPQGQFVGYGYWWWVLPPSPAGEGTQNIFAACGFRAQYIFVIPEHEMVVVVTGGARNGKDMNKPIEFLYSHLLTAVATP